VRGIACTVWRLLYVSALQRWLTSIGVVMVLIGVVVRVKGGQPGAVLPALPALGVMVVLISPIVIGPIMFRSVSAPRTIQLIPYGRLQLAFGAFCTQLLLALCIAITASVATPFPAAATCTIVFGWLTLFFLGFFWALQYPWVALVWLPVALAPQLLPMALPHLHLGGLLTTATGLSVIAATTLLAWLLFGFVYIRLRHLKPPGWQSVGPGSLPKRATTHSNAHCHATAQFSQRQAVQVLLAGKVPQWRRTVRVTISVLGLSLALYALNAKHSGSDLLSPFIVCLLAGIAPGLYTTTMMRLRAKFLWLTPGLDRDQLFALVESQSWRKILWFTGVALILVVPMLASSIHADPANAGYLGLLAIPVANGALFVYANMLYVRGSRPADVLIMAGTIALFFVIIVCAAVGSRALVPLACGQIAAVPLLRHIARRRWNQLDWLFNRRPVSLTRST
jgi:hypothetical protein